MTTTITSPQVSPEHRIGRLRQTVDVARMLQRPFFTHITHTPMTEDELRTFFRQYYVIVRTSYRMLAAGILSAPSSDVNMIVHLVRFLETESGGVPNHLAYYHRWAEAFGVTLDDLESARWNPHSQAFEDLLMECFNTTDSHTKLSAQLAVEDCAAVLIEGLDQGFRHFRMTSRTYGYLAAHRLLENDEDGHSRWALDELARSSDLDRRFAEVETCYQRVYQAFVNVFDGIYDEWQRVRPTCGCGGRTAEHD